MRSYTHTSDLYFLGQFGSLPSAPASPSLPGEAAAFPACIIPSTPTVLLFHGLQTSAPAQS